MRRVVPVVCIVSCLTACARRDQVVRVGEAPPIRREVLRPAGPPPGVHIRGPFSAPRPRPEMFGAASPPAPSLIVEPDLARRSRPDVEPETRIGFQDSDGPNFQAAGR